MRLPRPGRLDRRAVRRGGAVEQTYDRRLGVVANFAATIAGSPIVGNPATLRSIFLLSGRDATLELNSPTSPTQTIALKAGIPLEWEATSGYHANPITASFSGVYVTTAAAARVQIRILST